MKRKKEPRRVVLGIGHIQPMVTEYGDGVELWEGKYKDSKIVKVWEHGTWLILSGRKVRLVAEIL